MLEINSGLDLFKILKKHYFVGDSNSWWWPSPYSIEVENFTEIKGAKKHNQPLITTIIESILTQNTKYQRVQLAMQNLIGRGIVAVNKDQIKSDNEITLNNICNLSSQALEELIRGTGFYRQKSKRIITLFQNIKKDFADFETFSKETSKDWLLLQKGLGNESVSAILNYSLKKEEMVVDLYTHKLVSKLGFEMQGYEDLQDFLLKDMEVAYKEYDFQISPAQIYARFHGKIINCMKENNNFLFKNWA